MYFNIRDYVYVDEVEEEIWVIIGFSEIDPRKAILRSSDLTFKYWRVDLGRLTLVEKE